MSDDNPQKKGPQRKGQSEQRRKSYARRLAMQAIYSWLITDDRWQDIRDDFHQREEFDRADAEYFDDILYHVGEQREALMAQLAEHFDRPVEQLDPVEQAILMTGVYELRERVEVPYRVVLNEAVELAKRFGAAEGHRYVNALLDKVAATHRSLEVQARKRS